MLEERGESIQRFELMRVDRQKVSGLVVEPVVAGEENKRRGIRGFDDDVGDHHLEFFDPARGRGGGFGL
jgi:hypothetical protein